MIKSLWMLCLPVLAWKETIYLFDQAKLRIDPIRAEGLAPVEYFLRGSSSLPLLQKLHLTEYEYGFYNAIFKNETGIATTLSFLCNGYSIEVLTLNAKGKPEVQRYSEDFREIENALPKFEWFQGALSHERLMKIFWSVAFKQYLVTSIEKQVYARALNERRQDATIASFLIREYFGKGDEFIWKEPGYFASRVWTHDELDFASYRKGIHNPILDYFESKGVDVDPALRIPGEWAELDFSDVIMRLK